MLFAFLDRPRLERCYNFRVLTIVRKILMLIEVSHGFAYDKVFPLIDQQVVNKPCLAFKVFDTHCVSLVH
jgi:hypothetical protein